jgi:hypothetical protein
MRHPTNKKIEYRYVRSYSMADATDAIGKNMLLDSREGSAEHRLVDANALVEESLSLAHHGARAREAGLQDQPGAVL